MMAPSPWAGQRGRGRCAASLIMTDTVCINQRKTVGSRVIPGVHAPAHQGGHAGYCRSRGVFSKRVDSQGTVGSTRPQKRLPGHYPGSRAELGRLNAVRSPPEPPEPDFLPGGRFGSGNAVRGPARSPRPGDPGTRGGPPRRDVSRLLRDFDTTGRP